MSVTVIAQHTRLSYVLSVIEIDTHVLHVC